MLAQVARTSPEVLRERLAQAGHAPKSDADTIRSLVGADLGDQMRLMTAVLKPAGG